MRFLQFHSKTFLALAVSLLTLAFPAHSLAQKSQLKGAPVAGDTAKIVGKGSLKGDAGTVKDTLLGGDGFIPRTVIDSFARMPENSGLHTSVTPAALADSKKKINLLMDLVARGDSAMAIRKKNPSPEWPEDRIKELEDMLALVRLQLTDAEAKHALLQKRYESALSASSTKPPVIPSPKPQPTPSPATKPVSPAPGNTKASLKGG